MNAQTLAQAPVLVFNRKDALQAASRTRSPDPAPWQPPVWWVPSTRAFVQATLGGLGWTMNPLPLVQEHLDGGHLMLLRAAPGRTCRCTGSIGG